MRRATRHAACALATLALYGCESTPTTPSLFTTETFNGTVTKTTPASHTFITGQNAPVLIRMTAFNPQISMGLALGQPSPAGAACTVTLGQALVQQGSEFQVPLPPGTYCVIIFDAGNIPASTSVSYTTVIQHK